MFLFITLTLFPLLLIVSTINSLSTLLTPLSTIQSADEAESFYADKKVYAQLENADVYIIDYGVFTYKTRYGIKVSEEKLSEVFGFVNYEDGFVLTKMPKEYVDMYEESLNAVSTICKVKSLEDNDLYNEAYDEMISEIAEATGYTQEEVEALSPKICLEFKDGRQEDQVVFLFGAIGLPVSLFFLIRKIMVLSDYKKSKLYRELSQFGIPEQIEETINRNVDSKYYIYKSDDKRINLFGLVMPDFTIARRGTELHIFKTSDLIWAHVKVITRRVNFIPVNKTFSVALYFRGFLKPVYINFRNEAESNEFIRIISETLPVICGYNQQLKHTYKSNYMEFLQMADQYRTEFLNRKKQEEESQQPQQA